jgi:hypothetical protein
MEHGLFIIANLIILALNIKLYTEYAKDKFQDKRKGGN